MKRIIPILDLALGFTCLCIPTASAALFVTDPFDDLTPGDYGTQLKIEDVTFESFPGTRLFITDATSDGLGKATSLPNKLSTIGKEPRETAQRTAFDVLFDNPVDDVHFWVTGTFHDTTIEAFDTSGQSLTRIVQTYPNTAPVAPDGRPWDFYYDDQRRFIHLKADGISRVFIEPSEYDGFSIDNFNVVPEPSSLLLLGMGLLGGGIASLRKKRSTLDA